MGQNAASCDEEDSVLSKIAILYHILRANVNKLKSDYELQGKPALDETKKNSYNDRRLGIAQSLMGMYRRLCPILLNKIAILSNTKRSRPENWAGFLYSGERNTHNSLS